MHRPQTRRSFAALGLSLLGHGLLVAWLVSRPPPAAPPVRPPALQARLVWLEPDAVPAPLAAPPEQVRPAAATAPAGRSSRARPATLAAPAETAAPAPETTPPGASGGPRLGTLLPRSDLLGVTAGDAAPGDPPRGRTLHPPDLPSAGELRAEDEARVQDRVDGWARRGVAAARARGGLLDPAYGALGAALREATAEVPKFIDTDSAKEVGTAFAESWQAGAARYGATGQPYAEPEGRLESTEQPSALVEATARGSPDGIALSQFFAAGARLQEFADGRAGAELFALVEVRQHATGAVDSVTLLRPSGVVPFDRWVSARADAAAKALALDAGARDKPYRSVWRFDGVVTFRRKLKLSELDARAAVGMATMAALSLLSGMGNATRPDQNPDGTVREVRPLGPRMPGLVGRFDELSGEVGVVDLTNPEYDCRVTLLEAD